MSDEELRALDAEVAVKVMGWTLVGSAEQQAGGLGQPPGTPRFSSAAESCPRYSTDLAAAWLVVEKMLPVIGHIYPACDVESGKLLHWCAVIETDGTNRRGVVAATAPLAICLAALMATEGK